MDYRSILYTCIYLYIYILYRVLGELEYLIETPGSLQIATGQTIALFFEILRPLSDNVSIYVYVYLKKIDKVGYY